MNYPICNICEEEETDLLYDENGEAICGDCVHDAIDTIRDDIIHIIYASSNTDELRKDVLDSIASIMLLTRKA